MGCNKSWHLRRSEGDRSTISAPATLHGYRDTLLCIEVVGQLHRPLVPALSHIHQGRGQHCGGIQALPSNGDALEEKHFAGGEGDGAPGPECKILGLVGSEDQE